MMVYELTEATFDEFLNSEKPVVVDFYATWCGPCKMLSPILAEVADEYADQIVVGKLDVDQNPEVASKYGVMSMPTLLVFHNGAVVNQLVGLRPKPSLVDSLGLGVM